jgi:predicted phosphodiesterase
VRGRENGLHSQLTRANGDRVPIHSSSPVGRVGVIGDVHAEHARLEAALDFMSAAAVDAIWCTGDLADGSGDVDACCELLRGAGVSAVAGNHDRWLLSNRMREVPQAHALDALAPASRDFLAALPTTRAIETLAGTVLLCHGVGDNDLRKVWPGSTRMPIERSRELDALIDAAHVRYVVNGHLHYRIVVNFERLTLINGGTLRGDHRPGVSIVDFGAGAVSAYEFDARLALHRVAERAIDAVAGRRIWRDTQEFDGGWTPVTLYAA